MSETLLDTILAPGGLRMTLQPIFDMSDGRQRVFAVECLARGPAGTNLERADILFDYVRRKKEEATVDRACVMAGLVAARSIPESVRINVNVHASTLGRDAAFAEFVADAAEACGIAPERVVVEIVEHSPYWDGSTFRRTLEAIRAAGMAVALDDVGTGFSNYGMMIDCHPQFLKIDRYIVSGCDGDPYRHAVLESIQQLTRRTGARIIAEGIERAEELAVLLGVGMSLMQGYLLSRNRTSEDLASSGIFEPRPHLWRPAPGAGPVESWAS
ncbi:MAG: EAL domain-containing protein [Thermoanaerobaculia bacterium]